MAIVGIAALSGCGPHFDHLDFAERTSPPFPAELNRTGVTIPAGIAVAVTPIAMTDDAPMEDVSVELVTSDSGVLGLDHDAEGGFVIYGVSQGLATISIFVDGDAVGTMPAKVTPQ
ncbi:MAG: hypothetical protein QM820_63195 [Minicystis sp.]